MPLAADSNLPIPGVEVEVSAVVDLYVFISGFHRNMHELPAELSPSEAMASRLTAFWNEPEAECGSFDELLVLAAIGGLLVTGDSVDPLLEALPDLASRPVPRLRLRTEQEDTRERVRRHLDALRDQAGLRDAYVALLRDAAAEMRLRLAGWTPRLQERAAWYRERLADGEDVLSLAPARHLALLPRYRGLVDEAIRDGRVLLVPNLSNDLIYDLPGVMLMGLRIALDDPVEEARRRTVKIAERLRPLGDPTRLAIAAYLSSQPASVSGLARAFGLAQPTVSAHVRQLRTAGLLDSTRAHGMTEFRLAARRVADLFADAQKALFPDD